MDQPLQENIGHMNLVMPPKVVILLVLLISWMEDSSSAKDDIEVIEYFAGVGRIAILSQYVGYRSVAYDMDYAKARPGKRSPMDLNSPAGLVLAIKLLLRCRFNKFIAVFATCCSSWVPVNRGTGFRDILVPEGDERVVSVRKSNKLVSRNLVSNSGFSLFPRPSIFLKVIESIIELSGRCLEKNNA